jgi:hypothetical protein
LIAVFRAAVSHSREVQWGSPKGKAGINGANQQYTILVFARAGGVNRAFRRTGCFASVLSSARRSQSDITFELLGRSYRCWPCALMNKKIANARTYGHCKVQSQPEQHHTGG